MKSMENWLVVWHNGVGEIQAEAFSKESDAKKFAKRLEKAYRGLKNPPEIEIWELCE